MSLAQALQLYQQFVQSGRFQDAEDLCAQLLAVVPQWTEGRLCLAHAQVQQGKWEVASANYQAVVEADSSNVAAWVGLGNLHYQAGRDEEGLVAFREAVRLDPERTEVQNGLGLLLLETGHWREAEQCLLKAIALAPGHPLVLYNLGKLYQEMVRLDEAVQYYRLALKAQPDWQVCHSNLLFVLNYHPHVSAEEWFQAYLAFGEVSPLRSPQGGDENKQVAISSSSQGEPVSSSPLRGDHRGGRLRIGYLSPDFVAHPMVRFIEPVLAHHDRSVVEVFAYANNAQDDDTTRRLKTLCDHWRPIYGQSDDHVVQQVQADRIDILVDLAGHSVGNRLAVFARRPAAIQVTWIGIGSTTGLTAVDYFLADPHFVPEGAEQFFSERVFRLPRTFWVYRPPIETPDVSPLPALVTGQVTFGCFSRAIRLNERVIALWSALLRAVPQSRLLLNTSTFANEEARRSFWARFARHGVDQERIHFQVTRGPWETLNLYREIDMALDPFPHHAGITTLEALWMGVPVISLLDRPPVGRFGASILHNAGLSDWLADGPEAYVAIAQRWSRELEGLQRLRQGLRRRIEASPLRDEAGFTRALEAAYLQMGART